MKKVYAEIGFGNETFFSTEIEEKGSEYRIKKFLWPKKVKEIYFRFWFFRKVFIFSIPKGISIKNKGKNKFKILFGIGGV